MPGGDSDAQRAVQRSTRFLVLQGLAGAVVVGVASVPAVAAYVPVRPAEMALVVGVTYLASVVSALIYWRRGSGSRLYLVAALTETLCACIGLMTLIFRSGRGDCPLWLFYLVTVTFNGSLTDRGPALGWVVCLPPAAVAGAFAASGDLRSAALSVVAGLFCLVSFVLQSRAASERGRLVREREEALRELAELRVTRERERIARDLHDGIGADLAAIAWRAARLSHAGDASAQDLSAVSGRATRSIDDLRGIVWSLREPSRPWPELCAFIESRVRDLVGADASVTVRASESGVMLPGEASAHIVRIVDEAVRNARQHGQARHLVITLRPPPLLFVAVEDDGGGLPTAVGSRSGLANLEARAQALGGQLTVRSAAPGTIVEVQARLEVG